MWSSILIVKPSIPTSHKMNFCCCCPTFIRKSRILQHVLLNGLRNNEISHLIDLLQHWNTLLIAEKNQLIHNLGAQLVDPLLTENNDDNAIKVYNIDDLWIYIFVNNRYLYFFSIETAVVRRYEILNLGRVLINHLDFRRDDELDPDSVLDLLYFSPFKYARKWIQPTYQTTI